MGLLFWKKENKKFLSVAGVVFYDKNFNIAVQVRGDYSKTGEKYSFWGGRVEEDETPFQAVKREMAEELGFIPEKLEYWDKFTYTFTDPGMYKDYLFTQYVFLAPISEKLLKAKVSEGKGMTLLKLDDVLGGVGFPSGSTNFMTGFEKRAKTALRN